MKFDGLLLLGPTGSGKTPLGAELASRGLAGRSCLHFDFGETLRAAASSPGDFLFLSEGDLFVIRESLGTGALLEDEHFPIARALLLGFADTAGAGEGDLLVLNGLPRHTGQARHLESTVEMKGVVHLSCDPETVSRRIRRDTGGDRRGRTDDSLPEIAEKLDRFRKRTEPLIAFYQDRGVETVTIEVGVGDRAADMVERLARF
jgi:adenylate kinase family enzyme